MKTTYFYPIFWWIIVAVFFVLVQKHNEGDANSTWFAAIMCIIFMGYITWYTLHINKVLDEGIQ